MLVYSHTITPRVQYIVDFLSRYYSHPFKVTGNPQTYAAAKDPKINYSHERLSEDEFYLKPCSLLFESEKRPHRVEVFEHHGYKAFFRTEGHFPFDLFAAIFFLITRYEEYLPHKKDAYGRFAHENALAFREGFLHDPVVNRWLDHFREVLLERSPGLELQRPAFRFLPTYDIDVAWSYRNKGFKRNFGGFMQSFFKGKFRAVAERLRVLRGRQPDPYDSYAWMDELHRAHSLQPVYFFPLPKERGKWDRNTDITQPALRVLVQELSARYATGLHPSWASGDVPNGIASEKRTLEEWTGKPVTRSRQHYIRMSLPSTYQQLIGLGITEEHSMGYGSINGFRASIATPYFWYDLQREEATRLQVFPFCFMDANAYYEEGLGAEEAYA
ncbi:MAG TPA: hypothetical protein VHK69_18880, partial [Chitinophagaceae bacterium]|nr:hypothetical protein [Chitinophagaceae bacterium]